MFVTIYNGSYPNKEDSDNIHTFKCLYVSSKDNSKYILFDYVDDYKNIGNGKDIIIAGGKITVWLKHYKFTIEKYR